VKTTKNDGEDNNDEEKKKAHVALLVDVECRRDSSSKGGIHQPPDPVVGVAVQIERPKFLSRQ
jgi:hypothetical protein